MANVFNISSTVDSTKLHERPSIHSHAPKAIALHVRFTFFCDNERRNVEQMLKQSLNAFKLIQHRFNFNSTSFKTVSRGSQAVLTLLFNKIQAVCSGLNLPRRVNSQVRTRSCNMSPPHFLVCVIAAILSLLHLPATCPCYTALSVYSTRFCQYLFSETQFSVHDKPAQRVLQRNLSRCLRCRFQRFLLNYILFRKKIMRSYIFLERLKCIAEKT